jgi:hypothetical protein
VKRALVAAALLLAAAPAGAATKALGLNVHQSATVGVDAAHDAGVGWIRIDLNWLDAEPTQGTYDWSRFDTQIDAAVAKNLNVLAVLAYGPAWASDGDTKSDGPNNDVPKAGTYAAFVTAAVNRYKAKVSHYEIWNEPNLGQFFEGTPQQYIDRVFVPGADAVHAACAGCKVVGPGLATVGTAYATWLDAVLTAAEPKLDIVSGHIYSGFPDGSGTGSGFTSDSFFNKLESHRVIKIGSATIYEGPLSFKEVMDAHAVTKPFWLTETGKEATLGSATEEEAQRVYYRQVMEQMLIRSWWTTTIFYEGFDEPPAPYKWGVVVHDAGAPSGYVPKAVFSLLQKVTSSQPAFGGTKTDCDDGLDNDLDGQIDYPADTTCSSLSSPSEGVAPAPDAGSSSGGASSSSGGEPPPDGADAGGGGAGGGAGGGGGSSGDGGGCAVAAVAAVAAGRASAGAGVLGLAVVAALRARRRRSRRRSG